MSDVAAYTSLALLAEILNSGSQCCERSNTQVLSIGHCEARSRVGKTCVK